MKEKIKHGGIVAALTILIVAICSGISWIVLCGIIKLITMCFGWEFSWAISTGIWLILLILRSIFNVTVKKD